MYKHSRVKLISSLIIFALAIWLLLPLMSNAMFDVTNSDLTPDSSFFYDLNTLKDLRELYGQEGITAYIQTRFTYDLVWPAIYLFFMVGVLGALLRDRQGKAVSIIKALPILAVVFDLLENSLCSLYFSFEKDWLGVTASYASQIKWLMILLVFLAMGLLIILNIIKRLRKG